VPNLLDSGGYFCLIAAVHKKLMTPKPIKSLLAVAVLFCAPVAFAADAITIPSLTINGQTYKNVEIGTVSGSRVTIFYDGGGERVAISNLPADLQQRLHYDPALARSQDAAAAQKKAAINERLEKEAGAIAKAKSTLGPSQTIRVLKVINSSRLQIVANGMLSEAYIHNLPIDVLNFVRDYNATKASVDADKNVDYHDVARSGGLSFGTRQQVKIENLRHLADLEGPYKSRAIARSTVVACPTSYIITGAVRQWEFQSMPAASVLNE
jgi:hypothetical protein